MDPYSRAAKKNTSHRTKVLLQDTTHLIQRSGYQQESPCQDPAAIKPHKELMTMIKRSKLKWCGHVSHSSGLAKTMPKPGQNCARHSERGKKMRQTERGGKTTSGNRQAWSSAGPRGQWKTGENGENWLQNHLLCPDDSRWMMIKNVIKVELCG